MDKGKQLAIAALSCHQTCEIFERILHLNEDETAVLAEILDFSLRGLEKGRTGYGPMILQTDARDFVQEADEEIRDCGIYLAAAKLKAKLKTHD